MAILLLKAFLMIFLFAAKKFGVTDFINPKDHEKPVQQVSSSITVYYISVRYAFSNVNFEYDSMD